MGSLTCDVAHRTCIRYIQLSLESSPGYPIGSPRETALRNPLPPSLGVRLGPRAQQGLHFHAQFLRLESRRGLKKAILDVAASCSRTSSRCIVTRRVSGSRQSVLRATRQLRDLGAEAARLSGSRITVTARIGRVATGTRSIVVTRAIECEIMHLCTPCGWPFPVGSCPCLGPVDLHGVPACPVPTSGHMTRYLPPGAHGASRREPCSRTRSAGSSATSVTPAITCGTSIRRRRVPQ